MRFALLRSLIALAAAGVVVSRMNGFGRRQASNVGFTTLGRGEFSLILASFAAAAGLDDRIGPFVALYVLVLALGAPMLASRSKWLARLIPERVFMRRALVEDASARGS
jgi:CPA2 family monovalent cation:H+ antiporter-2